MTSLAGKLFFTDACKTPMKNIIYNTWNCHFIKGFFFF